MRCSIQKHQNFPGSCNNFRLIHSTVSIYLLFFLFSLLSRCAYGLYAICSEFSQFSSWQAPRINKRLFSCCCCCLLVFWLFLWMPKTYVHPYPNVFPCYVFSCYISGLLVPYFVMQTCFLKTKTTIEVRVYM